MNHNLQILILAVIQGMAELLPVSSSAHVIVAEKLMGLDPTTPEMTFLLVMLHTGTMFAVLMYFWRRWFALWKSQSHRILLEALIIATAFTGVVGLLLKKLIEKIFIGGEHAEIEQLFGNLHLIGISLFAAGLLILVAGKKSVEAESELTRKISGLIGMTQGLCLPFRGFSRSGATISVSLLLGISRELAESFSFALAVILTPPVLARELLRLSKYQTLNSTLSFDLLMPGIIGMIFSFGAGLIALRWLSAWMEKGRFSWFGYYCIGAGTLIFVLNNAIALTR